MNIAPHIASQDNWLAMDKFMDIALFDAEEGYYSRHVTEIGRQGDFSTCATQSRLLARGIVEAWRKCCADHHSVMPIIEIGGGTGNMMLDIKRELGFLEKLRLTYHMVERSDKLRELQKMLGGGFVRTHSDIAHALKATKGRAFIFSNELPDAFPARQFVFQEGEWLELGLAVLDGQYARQGWKRPLPASCVFERWAQETQVVEVHESYHKWYHTWQPLWKAGTMVTIDYGDVNETLYYRRPHGSMRGYKAHQMLSVEQLPALAGACDITCDVNFTDLLTHARSSMGDVVLLVDQHDFLLPLADKSSPADCHLIAKPGAGDHFKVLIHQRFGV